MLLLFSEVLEPKRATIPHMVESHNLARSNTPIFFSADRPVPAWPRVDHNNAIYNRDLLPPIYTSDLGQLLVQLRHQQVSAGQ